MEVMFPVEIDLLTGLTPNLKAKWAMMRLWNSWLRQVAPQKLTLDVQYLHFVRAYQPRSPLRTCHYSAR